MAPLFLAGALRAQLPIKNADPWVNARLALGPTEFLVVMREQADLSPAAHENSKVKKGEFVVKALQEIANDTQPSLRQWLKNNRLTFRPFWVVNMILVRARAADAALIAARPEVARLCANPHIRLVGHGSLGTPVIPLLRAPEGTTEWGLRQVRADEVWKKDFKGQGIVVGDLDSGVLWTHEALKAKYRGWNGVTADHNYNWHDAIHEGGGRCEHDFLEPCDDTGHGTHTTGTMVGESPVGNHIGVAPDAKWIACRSMNQGIGSSATFSECFEWFLAPRKVRAVDGGRPALAPAVINASWVCPPSEDPSKPNGCEDPTVLKGVIDNVRAAGIVVVVGADNHGEGCGSIDVQPATFNSLLTVGALVEDGAMWKFSSRGPATIGGVSLVKPNVAAPGVKVYSSMHRNDQDYGEDQGTSMASPHVAGAVALLLSAYPHLLGDVDAVETALERTAVPPGTSQACGNIDGKERPNNTYGWGVIDVLEAIKSLSADRSVAIAESADPVRTGAALTYKVTVRNSGPASASGVTVVDTLPTGAEVASVTPSQGNCRSVSTTVSCDLGRIALNGEATVTIVVTPAAAGTLKTSVVVDATEPDLNSENDSASVETVVESAGPG